MAALTEAEIFSCLSENLRLAAECCDDLATLPAKGPTYDKLRKQLRLIEGACRQASAWREDTRWLPIGRLMAECHQKAGGALRGVKMADGTRVTLAPGETHPFFKMLATNLRALQKAADDLRTKATGRVGMILPKAMPAPHRDTTPIGWRKSGALLIPSEAA